MVHSGRRNFRRGGYRGYRSGNIGFADYSYYKVPEPLPKTVFDYALDGSKVRPERNQNDIMLDREIMERAANLTPSEELRARISEYAHKVMFALEKERIEKTLKDVGIAHIFHVGSFVCDTTTHSSDKSDVAVQLNTLPSYETVCELGRVIVENMKSADPKETGEPLPTAYGCLITSHSCQVRVLVTINANDSSKLEPELHLDERLMMVNCFSIRHVHWFAEIKNLLPPDFIQELQALVKVLKEIRSRFSCFQHISPWTILFLSFFCLLNGPYRQKVCVSVAFRRFFENLAAGILLPKSACLIDPTCPNHRIGFDLSPAQMDEVCSGAQTLIRVFSAGNDGFRAILGTHGTAADLTRTPSTWKGIEIVPGAKAYEDDSMDKTPENI